MRTSAGLMPLTTPVSEPITTRSSSVTQYREGRSPLRSSEPPTKRPSVNTIDAGPSQGSIIVAWYS